MATWGAHMRIAENILSKHPIYDIHKFTVGNLAPDCNKPNEDWSEFDPPKKITHWIDENNKIIPEDFYQRYLGKTYDDYKLYSFLIGYYVHLLTDVEFEKALSVRMESPEYAMLKVDKNFIWEIKKDWYDLDFKYFNDNRNNIFNNIVQYIDEFPDYLDYFPEYSIINKLEYIINFYKSENSNFNRKYKYLTELEMNNFVDNASNQIIEVLRSKGLMNGLVAVGDAKH